MSNISSDDSDVNNPTKCRERRCRRIETRAPWAGFVPSSQVQSSTPNQGTWPDNSNPGFSRKRPHLEGESSHGQVSYGSKAMVGPPPLMAALQASASMTLGIPRSVQRLGFVAPQPMIMDPLNASAARNSKAPPPTLPMPPLPLQAQPQPPQPRRPPTQQLPVILEPSRIAPNKVGRNILIGESSSSKSPRCPVDNPMPVYGSISIQGMSPSMEDALLVKEDLSRADIFAGQALHYFGVYDGHGGPHVAQLCKKLLHTMVAEDLERAGTTKGAAAVTGNGPSGRSRGWSSSAPRSMQQQPPFRISAEWQDAIREAIEKSFERMDAEALTSCACGRSGCVCSCDPLELAFAGSTAVVAILTSHTIIVANCGDSRAVLCRGGRALPLSFDHKPERPDEFQRLEAAGAKIVYNNGIRLYGILNMSRSLGDSLLKSVMTSEPEVSFTGRAEDDECLILASDGLWDVMSPEFACDVARRCLREEDPAPEDQHKGFFLSQSALAAAVLCRLALARGSHDNITIIVVDLKRNRN